MSSSIFTRKLILSWLEPFFCHVDVTITLIMNFNIKSELGNVKNNIFYHV